MTIQAGATLPYLDPSARQGSEPPFVLPSFDRVYEEHFQAVWRMLRRLGLPDHQLEDAAQDVFVVVHRQLSGFERRSSLRTWLFGITVRVASDWRRKGRRRPTEPLSTELPTTEQGPLDEVARSEAVDVLYQLLDRLSADQREVFVLAELEELGTTEIAELLQQSVHTVKSRLQQARRTFESALARHHARDRWRQP